MSVPAAGHELLRAACGGAAAAAGAWSAWRARADLDTIAAVQRELLPLVVARRPELLEGDAWRGRLVGLYRRAWYANQNALRELAAAFALLQRGGVEALVGGGTAALLADYHDLGARSPAPPELLVRPMSLAAAAAALREGGWSVSGALPAPEDACALAVSPPVLAARRSQVPIALGWRSLPPGFSAEAEEAPWRRLESVLATGVEVRVPSRADRILTALARAATPPAGCRLLALADAAAALAGGVSPEEWSGVVVQAAAARAAAPAREGLALLGSLALAEVPVSVEGDLSAAGESAGERRFREASVDGGPAYHLALAALLHERAPSSWPGGARGLARYAVLARGGGTLRGAIRWALAGAVRRVVSRPRIRA